MMPRCNNISGQLVTILPRSNTAETRCFPKKATVKLTSKTARARTLIQMRRTEAPRVAKIGTGRVIKI